MLKFALFALFALFACGRIAKRHTELKGLGS